MKRTAVITLCLALMVPVLSFQAEACTSFILKAKDGSPIYGRTCEWGVFDVKSDLVLVPRNLTFASELGNGRKGISWTNKYGYVAVNAINKPFYLDGMNETGLIVGALYLPGFSEYQPVEPGKEYSTLNNLDLVAYILGRFDAVGEIKAALPELRVVSITKDILDVPMPVHYVVVDNSGKSIVIEYIKGKLRIYDNDIGVMTNSPGYDWHLLNLRNYAQLTPYAPGAGDKEIDGVNITPFSGGVGMTGLPGDYSSPARFVRAFFYTQTSVPLEDSDAAVNQASRILDNFDYPKGFERTGTPDEYVLGYTQWSTIGDIRKKRYYWWTEWNRRMRMVDLAASDFTGTQIVSIPLDRIRVQDTDDRTAELSR